MTKRIAFKVGGGSSTLQTQKTVYGELMLFCFKKNHNLLC